MNALQEIARLEELLTIKQGTVSVSQDRDFTMSENVWNQFREIQWNASKSCKALRRVLEEVRRATDKDFYEHCQTKVAEVLSGPIFKKDD